MVKFEARFWVRNLIFINVQNSAEFDGIFTILLVTQSIGLYKLNHHVFYYCTRTSKVSTNYESTADRVMIFVRMSVLYYIQGMIS